MKFWIWHDHWNPLKGPSSLLKFLKIEVSTTGDTGPAAMYFGTEGGFSVEGGFEDMEEIDMLHFFE